MQPSAGPGSGASAAVIASRQLLDLVTGTARSSSSKPIIGPPQTSLRGWLRKPPQCSARVCMGVPTRTSRLRGSRTARPVTVTTREISGRPRSTASATAAMVATFWQTMPICAGMPWLGTSRPVRMRINWRSPPLG